jgi:predicted enzyme related to lactoylglutathione lyase
VSAAMELASVRIFVHDLPAAAHFYADVVGLSQCSEVQGAVLFGSRPQLVVEPVEPKSDDEGLVGRYTGLCFNTADADSLFDQLKRACVPTHGPPARQPWGGIFVHADDPSGNTITFVQLPNSAQG